MKTLAEIKENIDQTKYYIGILKLEGAEEDPHHEPEGVEEAEGYLSALEWVIEDEPITDSEFNSLLCRRLLELVREKPNEKKDPLEEEFPHLTRHTFEESVKQDQE
jgi:hypothetical protein